MPCIAVRTLALPNYLMQALRRRCASEGVTLFEATYACFAVLLARYANRDDVLVGSPLANRQPETAPLIGPFATPVALRLNVAGNPTLRQVLRRAADVTREALAHSDLPFEILLKRLKVRAVHGRNPLFQFYVRYQRADDALQVRDLTIMPLPAPSVGTRHELQLTVAERGDGATAEFDYDPALFDAAAAWHMLEYFEQLLKALAGMPDNHLHEIAQPLRTRPPRDLRTGLG